MEQMRSGYLELGSISFFFFFFLKTTRAFYTVDEYSFWFAVGVVAPHIYYTYLLPSLAARLAPPYAYSRVVQSTRTMPGRV